MSPIDYTLDDLVQATGFSKRQIRFYITRKLVPGAGDSRGPHATYGEETLRRLLLIRDLKETPLGPTGRTMTLDEIGHALDEMSPDEFTMAAAVEFEDATGPDVRYCADCLVDDGPDPRDSAREYLRKVRETLSGPPSAAPRKHAPLTMFSGIADMAYSLSERSREPSDELRDLLGQLQALLAELGSDTRFTAKAGEAGPWMRVTTPAVEIHVRQPDDHRARARLAGMAAALAGLLAREE